VRAEVDSARRDWEDAYRRLQEEARDPAKADALRLQLDAVSDELRKRVGGTYTLRELASEYPHAERWAREAVAERAATSGWPATLSIVEGAAFLLYSRGAVDYEP
jgi:alcohol dehydrogenase class IV